MSTKAKRREKRTVKGTGTKPKRKEKLAGPIKVGKGQPWDRDRDEDGPLGWLMPEMQEAYVRLTPRDSGLPTAEMAEAERGAEIAVDQVSRTSWRDILSEYRRRKTTSVQERAAAMEAAAVPGGINWLPLGPSVVLNGQTEGQQPIAGRISGLAIAPGGQIIFAASANGGVFRSDDGGTSWRSLMDGFDLDPTNFASASVVCGAIAIDLTDPKRVYVGTGEGDTDMMFRLRNRIVNALPAYRGVGPIRSDDGGTTWVPEASTPDLAGEAFFALAVDPSNRENVIGATTNGLYRRASTASGQFEWRREAEGVFSSVAVASAGGTIRFFAAAWGKGIIHSIDGGQTWATLGNEFPTTKVGRIALGVQANNPNQVYALVANLAGALLGLYRWDVGGGDWKKVSGVPNILLGSQGDYDIAIAVAPGNVDLIYIAGDTTNSYPFSGNTQRCEIQATSTGYKVKNAVTIGAHAHADTHVLVHTPNDPTELWSGCDGGVFLNRNPQGNGRFASQNNGLACLCTNFLAQHPTDPSVLLCGLQDNGTARTTSGPVWSHVQDGDGGYCLINWADPTRVLVYMNGGVFISTDGGASFKEDAVWDFGWETMTQPIVTAPYNPAKPADANMVAVGAGEKVYISTNFASAWPANGQIVLPGKSGSAFALAFASPSRLFIGTTSGKVFRADKSGSSWSLAQLDNAPAGPLGLSGLISDVAVDWADPTLASIYVAFGGQGNDRRRVWHFDGVRWEARSGPDGENNLLNVEHNALAVDRDSPSDVYVGADIGVWHSANGGATWAPLQNGLPDTPIYDLQIHPTQRLLRAATHGRGVFEIPLA
jgi:photosystem II stability/assembly factor-like uncharacterized protein